VAGCHPLHDALTAIAVGRGSKIQIFGSRCRRKYRGGGRGCFCLGLGGTVTGGISLLPGLARLDKALVTGNGLLHRALDRALHHPLHGMLCGYTVRRTLGIIVAGVITTEIRLLIASAVGLRSLVVSIGSTILNGLIPTPVISTGVIIPSLGLVELVLPTGITAVIATRVKITVIQVQVILLYALTLVQFFEKVFHVDYSSALYIRVFRIWQTM
jgi:hypothetical protein